MKQINKPLFALNKNSTYQQWRVCVDGNTMIVEFGKDGGKLQTKTTTCKPKNVGRSNATTAEEQAVLEAQSKWEKQVRLGYRMSKEELKETPSKSPMLASDASKKSHMIKYPCYISQKLDGLRVLVTFDDNGEPVFNSRGNKTYPIQGILVDQVKELRLLSGFDEFDGELYIHGLPLQKITSLAKKWRDVKSKEYGGFSSNDLEYHIFDVPSSLPWFTEKLTKHGWEYSECRSSHLTKLSHHQKVSIHSDEDKLSNIKFVLGHIAEDESSVKESIGSYMSQGYEGTIIRNFEGKYEYGQRSNDLLKWKLFQDTEAEVVDLEEDKNGEGILICRDREGVVVRLKMKGTHQDRAYENQLKNIGKWVKFTFQARTEDDNYQFPVGVGLREVNPETKEVEE